MSYSSRVYRQRNAHTHDEGQQDAFFGKQSDQDSPEAQNSFFQTKLGVNKPGDKYEKEADSVANAVTDQNNPAQVQQKKIGNIQRMTSAEDEKAGTNDARVRKDKELQEKPIQKKDDKKSKDEDKKKTKPEDKDENKKGDDKKKEEEEKTKTGAVQKKQEGSAGVTSPQLSSKIENAAGKGKALQPGTLKEMNSSFGAEFDDVLIHDDTESQNMNKELEAQAFTHGKDVYFNKGKYDPETKEGKNLLAHELTHVVQQNSAKKKD